MGMTLPHLAVAQPYHERSNEGHPATRNDKYMTNATRTMVGKLERLLSFASTGIRSIMT
jgi:hypothetical protein